MKKILLILVVLIYAVPVSAKGTDLTIVAEVGDNAISSVDVNTRLNLAIAAAGLPNNNETREKLKPQIIKTLIDETLYKEEARKMHIEATDLDIKTAMMNLEKQNNLKPGTFEDFLQKQNISVEAMKDQIRSQIIWSKLVNQHVRPQIVITDKEIDEKLEHISNVSGISELNISEIVLPVETPEDEKRVKSLANKLVEEINKGSDFASIAKEFSNSSTASIGGELGWLQEEHAPSEIISTVHHLSVGEVSKPFYANNNYYIIKLNDRRALVADPNSVKQIKIKQAFIEIPQNTPKDEEQKIAENVKAEMQKYNSCDDFAIFAQNIKSSSKPDLITVKVSDLNPSLRPIILETPVGSLTEPIMGPAGLHVFAVCDKTQPQPSIVVRDKVKEMLLHRKIDLQAQRYLQKIRNRAYIEIRS